MTRAPAPPLEIQYPLCGLCGNEVHMDGRQFVCPDCCISWPTTDVGDVEGTWVSGDPEQCPAIDGRFLSGGTWERSAGDRAVVIVRCALEANHSVSLRHASSTGPTAYLRRAWSDDDCATPEQLAAVGV